MIRKQNKANHIIFDRTILINAIDFFSSIDDCLTNRKYLGHNNRGLRMKYLQMFYLQNILCF